MNIGLGGPQLCGFYTRGVSKTNSTIFLMGHLQGCLYIEPAAGAWLLLNPFLWPGIRHATQLWVIALDATGTGDLAIASDLPMATWKAGADAADFAFVLKQLAD